MAPICEKCKPDKPELHDSAISNSTSNKCLAEYTAVQACMKRENGNISPCAKVWEAFRTCHSDASMARKEALK